MTRGVPRLAGLLAAFVLGGIPACVVPGGARLLEDGEGLPPSVLLEDVPFHAQTRHQCGPASLAMVLNWTGDPVTPEELIPHTYTPGLEGSLQSEIVTAARRRGRLPYPVTGTEALLGEIARRNPVLVLQNLAFGWYPVWHYAVVIGYDLPAGSVTLRSGTHHTRTLPIRVFRRTWQRSESWGLVVVDPSHVPVSASEDLFLQAAAGLENAGQYAASERAYAAALERWPGSVPAALGLGNSRHALGDLEGAENAFRLALRIDARAAPALNNLAVVLAARGRREEALAAAREAVTLGGPLAGEYEKTLRSIEAPGPTSGSPGESP